MSQARNEMTADWLLVSRAEALRLHRASGELARLLEFGLGADSEQECGKDEHVALENMRRHLECGDRAIFDTELMAKAFALEHSSGLLLKFAWKIINCTEESARARAARLAKLWEPNAIADAAEAEALKQAAE
jgi:hypothetical protein